MELKKLKGETIKSAKIIGHREDCDCENLLILEMESGKTIYVEGGYGGYTGNSCDEYQQFIGVRDTK